MSTPTKFLLLILSYSTNLFCQGNSRKIGISDIIKENKVTKTINVDLGLFTFELDSTVDSEEIKKLIEEYCKKSSILIYSVADEEISIKLIEEIERELKGKGFYFYFLDNRKVSDDNRKKLDKLSNFFYGEESLYDLLFHYKERKYEAKNKSYLQNYIQYYSEKLFYLEPSIQRPNFISKERISRTLYKLVKRNKNINKDIKDFLLSLKNAKINLENKLDTFKRYLDTEEYNKITEDINIFKITSMELLCENEKLKMTDKNINIMEVENLLITIISVLCRKEINFEHIFTFRTPFTLSKENDESLKKVAKFFAKIQFLFEEFRKDFGDLSNNIHSLKKSRFESLLEESQDDELEESYFKTFSIFENNKTIYQFSSDYVKEHFNKFPVDIVKEIKIKEYERVDLDKFFNYEFLPNTEITEEFNIVEEREGQKIMKSFKNIFLIYIFDGLSVNKSNIDKILVRKLNNREIEHGKLYTNLINSIEMSRDNLLYNKAKRNKLFCVSKLYLMIAGIREISKDVFLALFKIILFLDEEEIEDRDYDEAIVLVANSLGITDKEELEIYYNAEKSSQSSKL